MSWWLKAVPLILANAPTLVDAARKLLDKKRSTANATGSGEAEGSVEQRIALLENRERKMLELIESLASSNQQMIEAISVLRQRARISMVIVLALCIATGIALVRTFGA